MAVTLEQILTEVKSVKTELRSEMDKKFKTQKEEIMGEMDKKFKTQKEEIMGEMDKKLKAQTEEIKKEMRNEMDQKLNKQTKDIAEQFKNIVQYYDKKHRKQEKINDEMLRELKENRIAHKSYDARLYKFEFTQSNLESKISNKSAI